MTLSRTSWVAYMLAASFAVAVSQTPPSAPPDSVIVDSLTTRIIPHMGSSRMTEPRWIAERDRWQWTDARSLHQVLERVDGLYLRTTGEAGAWVGSSWLGGSSSDDVFSLDALPLADPLTGRVRLSLVPLEFLEGIERLEPSDVLMLGHRWNLVSRQYSSVRPITAIRFTQEPNETILTDAIFAQNIARSTNFLFGFQRHTTGGRFANAALNSWSLRSRIRANLADILNIAASWSYERYSRGLNGGVDRTQSPSVFDDVTAVVHRPVGYEIYERTDLSLAAVGRFLGDTLSPTRMSVSSRRSEREYRRPDLISTMEERSFSQASDVRFAMDQTIALPWVTSRASAEFGTTHIRASEVFGARKAGRSRMGVSFAGTFSDIVVPRFAIGQSTAFGATDRERAMSIDIFPGAGFRISAGNHYRPLVPTLQEFFRTDSTILHPTPLRLGTDQLTIVSLAWTWDEYAEFEVTKFERTQSDAVIAWPGATTWGTPSVIIMQHSPHWSGYQNRMRVRLWQFELSGEFTDATFSGPDTVMVDLPGWWGNAELAYQTRVSNDKLGIRVGVRSRFSDRSKGLSPDPATEFEVVNTTVLIGRSAALDLYGTMQIGDAFVTLSWENVTDAPWLRTAVYPMPDRQFKLGVRWEFRD